MSPPFRKRSHRIVVQALQVHLIQHSRENILNAKHDNTDLDEVKILRIGKERFNKESIDGGSIFQKGAEIWTHLSTMHIITNRLIINTYPYVTKWLHVSGGDNSATIRTFSGHIR